MTVYHRPLLELTTVPGLEKLVAEELKSLGVEASYRVLSGRVYAPVREKRLNVARKLRLVENVRVLFGESGSLEELMREIIPVYREYISGLRLFAVHAERVSKDLDLTSLDIARIAGKTIEEETGLAVSLDCPDIVFYVEYERGRYRGGLDLTSYRGLRDRPYRVFVHRSALNPVIAAAMCMLAEDAETIYDPFSGSGTIPLECAACGKEAVGSDISVSFVRGAVLNSRLARLHGETCFLVADVLSSPVAGRVDAIVTNPPFGIRERAIGGLERVYEGLFQLAARVSAERIVVLTPRSKVVRKVSEKTSYRVSREIPIIEGGLRSAIYVYTLL